MIDAKTLYERLQMKTEDFMYLVGDLLCEADQVADVRYIKKDACAMTVRLENGQAFALTVENADEP